MDIAFKILMLALLFLGFLGAVAFCFSFADPFRNYVTRKELEWLASFTSIISSPFLVFVPIGMIGRGEETIPEFLSASVEGGILSLSIAVMFLFVLIAWTCFLPAHLFANKRAETSGEKRPIAPYILNLAVGAILLIEGNFLYRLFHKLFTGDF